MQPVGGLRAHRLKSPFSSAKACAGAPCRRFALAGSRLNLANSQFPIPCELQGLFLGNFGVCGAFSGSGPDAVGRVHRQPVQLKNRKRIGYLLIAVHQLLLIGDLNHVLLDGNRSHGAGSFEQFQDFRNDVMAVQLISPLPHHK
jgi:hypothetical protein